MVLLTSLQHLLRLTLLSALQQVLRLLKQHFMVVLAQIRISRFLDKFIHFLLAQLADNYNFYGGYSVRLARLFNS
jgi:hypothetical protein